MDYTPLILDLAKEYSLDIQLVSECLKEVIILTYKDNYPSFTEELDFVNWQDNNDLSIPESFPSLGYRAIQILKSRLKSKLEIEKTKKVNSLLSKSNGNILAFTINSIEGNRVLLEGVDNDLSIKVNNRRLRRGDLQLNIRNDENVIYFKISERPQNINSSESSEVNNNNINYLLDRTSEDFISCLFYKLLPSDISGNVLIKVLQGKLSYSRSLVKLIVNENILMNSGYSFDEITDILRDVIWKFSNYYLPMDKVIIVRLNEQSSISDKISKFFGLSSNNIYIINDEKYKLPNWFIKRFHNKSELDLNITLLNKWLNITVV